MLFASKKDSDGDVADKTFYDKDKGILLGMDAKRGRPTKQQNHQVKHPKK